MLSKNAFSNITIILFNMVPIIGVAFYNWLPFEMFWLFWMETLILSFFNSIKILFSQGYHEADLPGNNPLHLNFGSSFRYFIVKIIIFFFYALFIIVFIGFIANQEKNSSNVMSTLVFRNKLFNLALILSFCINTFYIIKFFFINKAYLYSKTADYSALFDGRQIVIHVAIVLGAVGSTFLFKGNLNSIYSSIWLIAILCIAKCIFELFFTRNNNSNHIL